ncbi:MAG TPA: aromatic-ring-hydroxylating dioxygenase subunit beta [Candidatus Limnocylindria bacterium]|jgi:anthranilate 1,2-dioxygenase small subunit|nr:aromatic-ring-hydroxylating dioxygenase subunit beta [Candidatus Limnocylindria bacterium]
MTPERLRLEVEELYYDYVEALDEGELERWPEFFTEVCLYKIVPRENVERGLPLALMLCESRGMLRDRVAAVRQANVYAPRTWRHLLSNIRLKGQEGETLRVQANYAVFETLIDEETRLLNVGRYVDRIVRDGGALRFAEKLCIFDSVLVPGSLVYPI